MTFYKCDKCGAELGVNSVFKVYCPHDGITRELCGKCEKNFRDALRKASKEFFKGADNG